MRERRVYAADWFMRAAAIPCSLILAAILANEPPHSAYQFLMNFFIVVAAPVVIAGGWGATLGAAILDPEATRNTWQATCKGVVVSGASFLTYLFLIGFCLADLGPNPRGEFLKVFILLLIVGTLWFGWLVAAVGALAGALLYKKQGNLDAER